MFDNGHPTSPADLTDQHLEIAGKVASRLMRRYRWLPREDIKSYAYLGLAQAAQKYDDSRGVPFVCYALTKATFLAVDQMRKDGMLTRKDRPKGDQDAVSLSVELPDPGARKAHDRVIARDLLTSLIKKVPDRDRKLIMMYYTEHMTMKEIGQVFGISESAVCLRHKALMNKLRRMVNTSKNPTLRRLGA